MPRNLIPQEPLDWRAMRHAEPPRPDRSPVIAGVITQLVVWGITAAMAIFAGIGLHALLDPPKPQPFQMPPNAANLKPGDTRDLGSGWTVTRTR